MESKKIEQTIKKFQEHNEERKKKSSKFSFLRFLTLLLVLFCIYQAYENGYFLFYYACLMVIIFFVWLVRSHQKLKNEISDCEALIVVHEDILKRKGSAWKTFIDNGADFLQSDATQDYDLDIFGKSSLYQYLNVAQTMYGREKLASLLSHKQQDSNTIVACQEAIKECVQKESFTLHMTRLGKLYKKHAKKLKKKTMEDFFSYAQDEKQPYPSAIRYFTSIFPILTLLVLLSVIFLQVSLSIFMVFFTFSVCLSLLFVIKNNNSLALVDQVMDMMKDNERMFAAFSEEKVESTVLQGLQETLKDAVVGTKKLNRILGFVRLRSNNIMFFFANGFMLDFYCVFSLQKWKKVYGHQVKGWLEAIGSLEALLSLAQIAFVKDKYVFPDVLNHREPTVSMEHAKHPLIEEGTAIANSFQARGGSYIITGSNMSGKTTFLRTIGVNLVLFHAGAPVCASAFQATSLNLYTSMRVHDDVSEGISTFYAEILRIKQMMLASDKKEHMLVLIDEIFKGTNSADRILCAKQAIVRLHLPWVITMVSTHDFELCDLDKDSVVKARNYHFSEYYEGEKICFDYLLKENRCTTTNAKQLMKLAGF